VSGRARLARVLWQPPRPHGEQPRERTVGPLELFYDLVVVVLVAQAAHHLSGHLTWAGLREFAAVFTLTWIAWLNGSLHHELHGREDARGRSVFLLQIMVLVPLGAFIPEAGGARGTAFAADAAILFAVLAVLWHRAGRGDSPEYRRPSRLFVAGTAACVVVLAATAFMPDDTRVLAWLLLDVAYLAWFAASGRPMEPSRTAEPGVLPAWAVVSARPKPSRTVMPQALRTCSMTSGFSGSPAATHSLSTAVFAAPRSAWISILTADGEAVRPTRPRRARYPATRDDLDASYRGVSHLDGRRPV
jgi:hypothetical protein